MTTLIQEKTDRLSGLQSQTDEIIRTRLRIVEYAQLAGEIKEKTDQGLSMPYPKMSLFYGRQRAILRGLTQSDIIFFDLPTTEEWNRGETITYSTTTKFGFIFVDTEKNDSNIDNPSLYYLTKKKETNVLSTIEYDSDAFSYPVALDIAGKTIIGGIEDFEKDYEQVNFTVSTKSYFGQTLNIMNIRPGVLSEGPGILSTMYLRRKSNHKKVGIVQIACEGLETNLSWNPLTWSPKNYLKITHSQFKNILGYLSPDSSNDLTKSSNPELMSTGRKVGVTYQDIEESPFFPCTDGNYIASPPYTGNFVHSEEGVPKWSVHTDIKWQFGTAPASLGEVTQHNPGTVIAALNAIVNFSDPGNNPIPNGYGGSSSSGSSYSMNGNYVWEYIWTVTAVDGVFAPDSGRKYACYYNDVQQLKDNHLLHIQTQCDLILSLGDQANTIEESRQSADSQFIADTTNFKTALDLFLSYHEAFAPLSGRPTYDTSNMVSLKTATNPGEYLSQVTGRLSDLNSVIGTATTSGYAKIIYDTCNIAVHREVGYLRDVIDELNSIQDIYNEIINLQEQYALFP